MSIYKLFTIIGLSAIAVVATRCGSAPTENDNVLSHPAFVKSPAYFNTYVAGAPGGGSGVEFYLEIQELPAGITLEKVYFRKSVGKLMRGSGNYVARFRTDQGKNRDLVMSSNLEEEAVNTPPVVTNTFPFTIDQNEAGLQYRENGTLKYAILTSIEERESIAYPSQRPKGNGY